MVFPRFGIGPVAALTALSAVWAFVGIEGAPTPARADESHGVTGAGCLLRGTSPVPKGTQLFDAPTGGRVVANFSGAFVPMQLRDLPADAVSGRGLLSTSNGGPALRLTGWVPLGALPIHAARDLPVVPAHVWISSTRRVKLVRGAPGSLTVELTVSGSQSQTVRASVPCDQLSLERGTWTPMEVPGSGRGYVMKTSTLDLFDGPDGNAVFTLKMNEGSAQLFWSTESRGGFVHVQTRGDLTIDAWARWRDLEALKKGEMLDQLAGAQSAVTGAQLALDKTPPLLKATSDVPVRARRDPKEKPIGIIEAGAEVYVMETIAGWTNVLPRSLGMTPPEDGGFWIASGEIGK